MKGTLFVISGPSAVGKTSVANALLAKYRSLQRVITCTTRVPRGSEVSNIDYIFMSKNEFIRRRTDFIEYSEVYGNYYGVLLSSITDITDTGKHALLVINWEGYLKIKEKIQNVIGFFLLPPNADVLEQRIRGRAADSEETIQKRLRLNAEDMSHAKEFDYRVFNHTIPCTVEILSKYIDQEISK